MRIGLLGGSFDPPHNGHLLIAGDVLEALGLDRVIWIPAGVQPLKGDQVRAAPAQRMEMIRRLIADDPRFELSAIEIERGGLSYTVDTLAALADVWPAAELFWLVGADVLESFHKWKEPARIVELASLVVVQRDTGETSPPPSVPAGPVLTVATRRIDISSTEIRRRVRDRKSIRGFVPDAVVDYIAAEGLYR
ncbi:MAG: nicotinate-nucleotide adenylyltransferase [bacterium]